MPTDPPPEPDDVEVVEDVDVMAPAPPGADPAEGWAIDTALGAASIVARALGSVGTSPPARLAAGVTRALTRPLAREGHEVRGQLEEEATPAAKRLVAQVTPRVTEVVDLNEVLAAVDLNALLASIDLDALLDAIDLDALLDRLDLDLLMSKVDLDALLDRIDVDSIVARVDVGAVIARVDINAVMASVDVDELVRNTEIGGLIAKSTSGLASTALDGVRSHGVTLDRLVARWVNRLLRRTEEDLPPGPALLVERAPRELTAGSAEVAT